LSFPFAFATTFTARALLRRTLLVWGEPEERLWYDSRPALLFSTVALCVVSQGQGSVWVRVKRGLGGGDKIAMFRTSSHARWIALFLAPMLLVSCAVFGGKTARPSRSQSADEPGAEPQQASNDYVAKLHQTVDAHVRASSDSEKREHRIIARAPYYYKEYEVYPDGSEGYEILIQETESRTAPYVADVKLAKLRFATRFHRTLEDARQDAEFLRDTGTETITYEWRNGQWVRAGSIFIADATEEWVEGQWVVAEHGVERVAAVEDSSAWGWPKRLWAKVRRR